MESMTDKAFAPIAAPNSIDVPHHAWEDVRGDHALLILADYRQGVAPITICGLQMGVSAIRVDRAENGSLTAHDEVYADDLDRVRELAAVEGELQTITLPWGEYVLTLYPPSCSPD